MSGAFQKELRFLGIESSPAFIRASEGSGCAERFIRTLKENLLRVRTFDSAEELRQTPLDFRETYNLTWLIERHGLDRPARSVRIGSQPRLSPHGLQFGVPLTAGGRGGKSDVIRRRLLSPYRRWRDLAR